MYSSRCKITLGYSIQRFKYDYSVIELLNMEVTFGTFVHHIQKIWREVKSFNKNKKSSIRKIVFKNLVEHLKKGFLPIVLKLNLTWLRYLIKPLWTYS